MTPLRLAFMGTPDFAVPALAALIASPHEVVCVYSQPPRPAGRGKKPKASAVHRLAQSHGIEVRTPQRLKADADQQAFADLNLDAAVVAAYGLILPVPILHAPRLGCINIHASFLPRWRGAAPIHRAIMAGDEETGVCIMAMEAGLDTGPVLLRETRAIGPGETTGALHDRLAALGARLIVPALEGYAAGRLVPQPQPDSGVVYAPKIDKAEARIDWTRPAVEVDRLIRGLSPFPGAWCEAPDGTRLKLLGSRVEPGAGASGTLLDDALLIAGGTGALRVLKAQRPGKGAMDAATFLRGFALRRGDRLS